MSGLSNLHRALAAAGVPLDGVAVVGEGYRIDYRPEATDAQRVTAAAVVASRDWSLDPSADYAAAVAAGYPVTPEGFTLRLQESDRTQFSQLAGWIREALDLGALSDASVLQVADATGVLQTVSVARLREILVGYGGYYLTLWSELVAAGG